MEQGSLNDIQRDDGTPQKPNGVTLIIFLIGFYICSLGGLSLFRNFHLIGAVTCGIGAIVFFVEFLYAGIRMLKKQKTNTEKYKNKDVNR